MTDGGGDQGGTPPRRSGASSRRRRRSLRRSPIDHARGAMLNLGILVMLVAIAGAVLLPEDRGRVQPDMPRLAECFTDDGAWRDDRPLCAHRFAMVFQIAEDSADAATGWIERPYSVWGGSDRTIWLDPGPPVIALDAITRIGEDISGAVSVSLTNDGTAHLFRAAEDNQGLRMAVMIRGVVLTAPRINGTLTGEELVLGLDDRGKAALRSLNALIETRDAATP